MIKSDCWCCCYCSNRLRVPLLNNIWKGAFVFLLFILIFGIQPIYGSSSSSASSTATPTYHRSNKNPSIPTWNNNVVVNSENSFRDTPSFFQVLKGIALTILVLWTVAANTLVFVVLYKNPNLQTTPNLLVSFLDNFLLLN